MPKVTIKITENITKTVEKKVDVYKTGTILRVTEIADSHTTDFFIGDIFIVLTEEKNPRCSVICNKRKRFVTSTNRYDLSYFKFEEVDGTAIQKVVLEYKQENDRY